MTRKFTDAELRDIASGKFARFESGGFKTIAQLDATGTDPASKSDESDLARYALALRRALKPFAKLSTLHADGGYEQHIRRARTLLSGAKAKAKKGGK